MDQPSPMERAVSLIELLFDEGPAAPRGWQRFLAALCRELDAAAALIFGEIPALGSFVLGHDLEMRRVHPEQLRPTGNEASLDDLPRGVALPIAADDPDFASSPLFRDVLSPAGLPPGPGLLLLLPGAPEQRPGGLIALSRDRGWTAGQTERALVELLSPYLDLGARAGLRLNTEISKSAALLGSCEQLALGVILLDTRGRVSFANASAFELLGVESSRGGGKPLGRDQRRTLNRALGSFLRREAGASDRPLTYPHPKDGRPLHIIGAPLALPETLGAASHFATALFVSDPEGAKTESVDALGALYRLTPAEAQLSRELAAGKTVADAARALGIRLSTARGALRSVFAKTGTRRQASLVRLLLSGPAQLRLDRARPRGSDPGPVGRAKKDPPDGGRHPSFEG